jgi:hypothetical protein
MRFGVTAAAVAPVGRIDHPSKATFMPVAAVVLPELLT